MPTTTTPRPRLYLSQDGDHDWLTALEFGATNDGQAGDRWTGLSAYVGLLYDGPGGRCIGFAVRDPARYDPDDVDHERLWDGPRFDVPQLGLTDVAPNAIVVATASLYGLARDSLNRRLFAEGIAGDGEIAVVRWLRCLQSGDVMAHYGLGYELLALGRWPDAYRHLRHYCEIAPASAWAWRYLGLAAAANDLPGEARTAYERAVLLDGDEDEDDRSDAHELLDALLAGDLRIPEVAEPDPRPLWARTLIDHTGDAGFTSHAFVDGDGDGTLVMDMPGGAVLVDVQPGIDAVVVRTVAGRVTDGSGDEVVGALRAALLVGAPNFRSDEQGQLWVSVHVPTPFDLLTPALLEVLAVGVTAKANHLRDVADEHEIDLAPAPTYDATIDAIRSP